MFTLHNLLERKQARKKGYTKSKWSSWLFEHGSCFVTGLLTLTSLAKMVNQVKVQLMNHLELLESFIKKNTNWMIFHQRECNFVYKCGMQHQKVYGYIFKTW